MKKFEPPKIDERSLYWAICLCILASILPYLVFIWTFSAHPWSDSLEDWAHFGDFIAGSASPILAIFAVVITVIVAKISNNYNKTSLIHRMMEVTPLAQLSLEDTENLIAVNIENVGLGSMVINELSIFDSFKNSYSSLFDYLSTAQNDMNISPSEFRRNVKGIIIKPNEVITLIQYTFTRENHLLMNKIREKLSKLTINIKYSDVYENPYSTTDIDLIWFGRFIRNNG